uniref:DNA/RNA-binding protein Alba-like domain-containing protein n=1 Tax=Strombidium inclinatum TaxID=197538 RepID=A0A7S3II50_9SPIT|mmetsp:Transcript_18925/g.29047  ORF Transcript_18925/g.29047 Transcript_18925/m.29047 type:complete len:205 (+) Transcript_18925:15-629(+)
MNSDHTDQKSAEEAKEVVTPDSQPESKGDSKTDNLDSKTENLDSKLDKADKESSKFKARRTNLVIVRKTLAFRAVVSIAKNLLKNQYDMVELHAVDDQSFLTVTLATQCLIKYGYVTLTRLKTKTVQAMDDPAKKDESSRKADPRVVLQPRLVIHLTKTAEFDEIFHDFETMFKTEEEQQHPEDLEAAKEGAEEERKEVVVEAQ